ncbi:putative reverse transcriptase domain-containing protein [Tanacetum coccineum]
MASKRTTRARLAPETTTTTTSVTNAQPAMIDQESTDGTGSTWHMRELFELLKMVERMETVSQKPLLGWRIRSSFLLKMADKYCPRNEIKKLEADLWNLEVQEESDKVESTTKCQVCNTTTGDWDVVKDLLVDSSGAQGHFRRYCPKLNNNYNNNNNNNRGNQVGTRNAQAKVYGVGNAGTENPGRNVRYVSQIDIAPTVVDHDYAVELADGRIISVNTIIRSCTLNFLNHPFNIDLMPVEMGSFDVIIGMDWLSKYQAVIICADKIVTTKEAEDNLEKKRLDNVPIHGNQYRLLLLKKVLSATKRLSTRFYKAQLPLPWGAPVLFVKKKDGSFPDGNDSRGIETS